LGLIDGPAKAGVNGADPWRRAYARRMPQGVEKVSQVA